jgi:hypothetical protein
VLGGTRALAYACSTMLLRKTENICSFGVALVVGSKKLLWGIVLLMC